MIQHLFVFIPDRLIDCLMDNDRWRHRAVELTGQLFRKSPRKPVNQSTSQSINKEAIDRRRLSLAASKATEERRKKSLSAHTLRLNNLPTNKSTSQSTNQPIVPPLVWPAKLSSSTKSINNENAPPTSARRQTLGAPLKKFDVPTSRARAASSTKRSANQSANSQTTNVLTDRSNTPSCQLPTISAAAKTKKVPRRSMKAQAQSEHVVEKRSVRTNTRQANERRASMEIKRSTRTRNKENKV